jgi:hypothetical protein
MEVSGHLHATAALTPEENISIYWIGGWLGPLAGVDAVE